MRHQDTVIDRILIKIGNSDRSKFKFTINDVEIDVFGWNGDSKHYAKLFGILEDEENSEYLCYDLFKKAAKLLEWSYAYGFSDITRIEYLHHVLALLFIVKHCRDQGTAPRTYLKYEFEEIKKKFAELMSAADRANTYQKKSHRPAFSSNALLASHHMRHGYLYGLTVAEYVSLYDKFWYSNQVLLEDSEDGPMKFEIDAEIFTICGKPLPDNLKWILMTKLITKGGVLVEQICTIHEKKIC